MMKSTNTRPLTVVLGLYLVSNSLSSMAYFISLPKFSVCAISVSLGVPLGF